MKRVIKFRALKDDMSNCNFVYGHLVVTPEGIPRITDGTGFFHTCIKNTEGQFTGLHDKNGKEIYEGDVLQWYNMRFIVFFDGINSGGWRANGVGGNEISGSLFYYKFDESEIIGNTHENPELIKPKEDA